MDQGLERVNFHDRPEKCNKQICDKLRDSILNNVKQSEKDTDIIRIGVYHRKTICILSFATYPQQFIDMYKNAIVDLDMKDDLERSNVINWCRTTKQLFPVKTTADGNCLLHAVSLALWGIEDSTLFLRRLLYLNITTDGRGMFKKRWLANQRQSMNTHRFDVRINTEEFSVEWESVIKGTVDVTQQENHGLPYTCLESIHLYILANILCRPIIVLADRVARNVYGQSLQENEIGGIYLPLDSSPQDCHKTPILIGYNMNHFAPLVFEESDLSSSSSLHSVPLVTNELNSLQVHYLLLDEEPRVQALLTSYLTVNEIVYTARDGPITIPAVLVKHEPLPIELNIMEAYKTDCENMYTKLTGENIGQNKQQHFQFEVRNRHGVSTVNVGRVGQVNILPNNAINIVQGEVIGVPNVPHAPPAVEERRECLAMGCQMYGTEQTRWFCSKCFKKGTIQYHKQEEAARRSRKQQVKVKNPQLMNGHGRPHHVPKNVRHHGAYQDISIMGEDCHAGCGFKCSTETYPYCHECHPKFAEAAVPPAGPLPQIGGEQEVQLSMLPDSCITENCMFRCSIATKPYCHQCYKEVSELQRNTDPTAPPPSIHNVPAENTDRNNQQAGYHHPDLAVENTGNVITHLGNLTKMYSPNVQIPMDTSEPGRLGAVEGVLPRQCKMTGCPNQAVRGNDGMCESCYNTSLFGAGINVSTPPLANKLICHLQHINNIPTHDRQCSSPGCTEKANTGINQCTKCFLKSGDMPSSTEHSGTGLMPMNIVAPEDGEKILNSSENINKPITRHENRSPSVILQSEKQETYQQKQLCATEGCTGTHVNNEFGLCNTCYSKIQGKSDLESSGTFPSISPFELSEKEIKQLNPVVVSSRQKTKCNSPFCEEMIYPPKAYCEECLSALQGSRARKARDAEIKKGSLDSHSCRTHGCLFSGSLEFNGYCSQCFKGKPTELGKRPILNGTHNTFPLLGGNGIRERPHVSAPLAKDPSKFSGKLCIYPNCKRFGDPSQLDRCSQHYQQALTPSPLVQLGQTVSLHRTNLNAGSQLNHLHRTTHVAGAQNGNSDPFIQVIKKVEGDQKSKSLCKNNLSTGCQNYGNAKNQGFCNSCYPVIRRKELALQLAAAGGNKIG